MDRDVSQYADSPETPASKRNKAVLHRQVPFVALVNDNEEFKGLIDRPAGLDKLVAHLGKVSDDN